MLFKRLTINSVAICGYLGRAPPNSVSHLVGLYQDTPTFSGSLGKSNTTLYFLN